MVAIIPDLCQIDFVQVAEDVLGQFLEFVPSFMSKSSLLLV